MRTSIKLRLTVWYVALLAVILVALGTFLVVRLRTDLVSSLDHSLASRAAQIALNYEQGGESDFKDVSDAALLTGTHGSETAAQILSPARVVVQDSGDVGVAHRPMLSSAAVAQALRGERILLSAPTGPDGEPFRVLAARLPHRRVLVVA